MINGINILSQTEVVDKAAYNFTACIAVFAIIMIIVLILTFKVFVFKSDKIACIIFGTLFAIFIGLLAGGRYATPISYETYYKVTINDPISMNEFFDTYEIIDIEEKIFTIKEIK